MNYSKALVVLSLATVPSVIADVSRADEAPSDRRPNFVVVLVDDAGFGDFPFFADDRPRTAHIDRLTREGIRFTSYYANAPICSPSRAALITGRFPARVGITTYIASREENRQRGVRNWLDPVLFTLPRALQERGYATGHFGKWHLGGGRDVGDAPAISEYGFQESLTQFEGLGDRVLPLIPRGRRRAAQKFPLGVQSEKLGSGAIAWEERDQVTRAFAHSALDFIRRADSAGRPFYINVWLDDVHTPLHPPADLRGDGGKRNRYLGVLENMDAQLGELFDDIRAQPALRDNTIIMVMSDNGPEPGAGSAGKLRGAKGQLYEGGVRAPLVVWGPGWIDAAVVGTSNDETVLSAVDLVASMLALAGVANPGDLDGENLSETLLGRRGETRQAPLIWVRPPDRPGAGEEDLPDLAIREGRWKLLVNDDGSNPQLYDVVSDPAESVEASPLQPEIAARLQQLVLDWNRQMANAP